MRERISQLAAGVVDVESPQLELLVPRIEETVICGQNFRGDIRISSGNSLPFRGLIYSDDSRVALLTTSFAGTSAFIPYEVRAEQMDAGTELTGAFCLVTNGGEQEIPYHFRIREAGGGRDDAPRTLEEFTALAEERPQEAAELIDTRAFAKLPLLDDSSLRAVYDGLRRAPDRGNMTEEFLIAAGAKKRRSISVPEEEITVSLPAPSGLRIPLTADGWGRLEVTVSSDADWLVPVRRTLTERDIEEDPEIRLELFEDELHAGKNLCRVTVETRFQTFRIPVVCRKPEAEDTGRKKRLERRKEQLEFAKTLLNTLAGKGEQKENLEYLQYCWEEMTADAEPAPRQKLYRAAISLWREDRDLASLVLDDAERDIEDNRREDGDAYCAYLYLRMKVTDSWEQKERLFKILKHYMESGQDSPFLFTLLLHLDEGASDRPQGTLDALREYYEQGCRSPYLYLEAVRIYNRHPDIIRELDDFTCAVLTSAASRGYLTEACSLYIASLTGQEKTFRPEVDHILKLLYRTWPHDDLLSAICALLIKGECRRPEDYEWFAKGVERDIRLTRLYDYYLYTAPRNQKEAFPREIVLYFSYNSPRNADSQKLLYNNLLKFYDHDRQIMDSYRDQMTGFVLDSVRAGTMDAEMAPLYERLLELSDIDERIARMLPDRLNAWEIRCANPAFSEVIVVYGELEEELSAPIRDGAAVLPAYSDSCRFLLADPKGMRYAGDICEARRLMEHTEALEKRCFDVFSKHPMLRLKESLKILASGHLTETELRKLKRQLEVREMHRQFRAKLVEAIVSAAIHRPVPSEEEIVTCAHYPGVSREQRLALTELLIRQGRLAEAERQVRRIGYRDLPIESLLSLTSLSIQNGLYSKDELLVDMCRYLFDRGQADEMVLEYLCTHFNSSSRDMIPVLEEADARRLHLADMPERLLAQMLFTGSWDDIDAVYRIYRAQYREQEQEQLQTQDLLTRAYFVVKCDGYFIKGKPAGEQVFRFVEQELREAEGIAAGQETEEDSSGGNAGSADRTRPEGTSGGRSSRPADRMLPDGKESVPEVCRLALLRFYAEKELLTTEEQEIAGELLGTCIRQGKAFAWMRMLEGKIRLPEEIRCREWIEYHGEPGQHPELVVKILPEMKDKSELHLVFPEVIRGVYVKPFLLFAGDELQWEIRLNGTTIDSGTLEGQPSPAEDHSRYAELNRLQAAVQSGQRVQEYQEDVLDYGRREAVTRELFTLID